MLESAKSKATSCSVMSHFHAHVVALLLQGICEKWVVAMGCVQKQKKKKTSGDKATSVWIDEFI